MPKPIKLLEGIENGGNDALIRSTAILWTNDQYFVLLRSIWVYGKPSPVEHLPIYISCPCRRTPLYRPMLIFACLTGVTALVFNIPHWPVAGTQTQHHPHRCFSPALPAMKLCCSDPAVIIKPAVVAVAVMAMRQFRWWPIGLVSTGLFWLLIPYLCMVCTDAFSSSSLATMLNGRRLSLCELSNLHEVNYDKNKPRRLDTEVA